MNKIIYYAGNPIVEEDAIPSKIIPEIRKIFPDISFISFDPTEDIDKVQKNLVIIDTVKNIQKVELFDDMNTFTLSPRFSVHDYDLNLDLNILLKLKKIKKISIIGIPQFQQLKKTVKELIPIIRTISP